MSKRPNGIFKTQNGYQQTVKNFDRIPKAVFAAIAVSLMANWKGVSFDQMDEAIIEEWQVLHENGIVPQKPIKI